jgi:hypothetical protein
MKTTDGLDGPTALADTVVCRNDLRLVEAAGQSAWPAFASKNVHGWVWRNSGGGFGQSNSVFTLRFLGPDALEAVGEVEHLYREEGRRARIRVSDLSEPRGLRELLIGRGYTVESAGLVMAKPTQWRSIELAGVEWSHFPTPDWQKVYQGVIDEPRRRTIARLLAQVPRPHIFAGYRLHGLTLSIGLAVLVDGIATLECIATRERPDGVAVPQRSSPASSIGRSRMGRARFICRSPSTMHREWRYTSDLVLRQSAGSNIWSLPRASSDLAMMAVRPTLSPASHCPLSNFRRSVAPESMPPGWNDKAGLW